MNTCRHLLIGAAAAAAPDVMLTVYGWRRRWLPASHPLVRLHHALHHPAAVVAVGWATHLIADRYSTHRTEQTRQGRLR